jgi:GAF domain-containing protein/HAMP domain-containing protein
MTIRKGTREPKATVPESVPATTGVRGRGTLIERITLIGSLLGVLSIGLYIYLYFQTDAWQILAGAGFVALAIVCLVPARRLARREKYEPAGYWMLLAVVLAFGGGTLVWAGAIPFNALGGLLLIFLVGTTIRPRRWSLWLLVAVLFVAFLVLVELFQPLPRYDIAESAILRIHVPLVTAALVLLTLWQFVRAFRVGNLRTRMLIAFVAMVLLPLVILGTGLALGGLQVASQRGTDQVVSVVVLKAAEIDTWLQALQIDLEITVSEPQVRSHLDTLVQERPGSQDYVDASQELTDRLRQVGEQTGRFEELFLMDSQGRVLASTDSASVGKDLRSQAYFREALQGPYVRRPRYSSATMRTSLFVSQPATNETGEVLGVLAGRVSLDKLNEIMARWTGLGETGETYLVSFNHTLLTPTRAGDVNVWVSTEGIDLALDDKSDGAGVYENYAGRPVVGAFRWLPELQTGLLAEQEQTEVFGPVISLIGVAAGAALLGILVAVGVALLITRSIADPIANLSETATEIAGGDLERVAKVVREDEVGTLARAFNSMTTQLRELIDSLEQRVADRTHELERRSAYLEASAEVGRASSAILDPEQLTGQAVELIRDRFDLYYVGLFLVDESGEWAVLRSGTGEAGQAMLARRHRLRVGEESMIGWCIAHDQPRIALEAAEDTVRLATAELPLTRSEAALPLRSRGQVIGALTVQHAEPGAFDHDTIVVLQTMADQVAVALDNARLFAERQVAMHSLQRAYGELSGEAWRKALGAVGELGYRSDEHGVSQASDIWRPEMEQALREGRIVQGDGSSADGKLPLAVPIRVRGKIVGVLDTYKPASAGDWTEGELALLEQIVEQLDVTLESARLHWDAQRRAVREETIRRVTERMRRPRDVEAILQNTLAELTQALGVPRAYVRLGTEAKLSSVRGLSGGLGRNQAANPEAYPGVEAPVSDDDDGHGGA